MLEVRVHLDLDWDMLPDDYLLVAIDTAAIVAETIHEFPDDPRAVGDAWIEPRRSALLRVPSWIVPESHNVLIHPLTRTLLRSNSAPSGRFGSTGGCGRRPEPSKARAN